MESNNLNNSNSSILNRDLTHQTFNLLTVKSLDHIIGNTRYWLCECKCGNTKVVKEKYLLSGDTTSCGCVRNKHNVPFLHDKDVNLNSKNQKLHNVWINTIHRCLNPRNRKYVEYGAKGITICKEWQDFSKFELWAYNNGYKEGLALIRRNKNGSYEPSNCVWDIKSNYAKIQKDYNSTHCTAPVEITKSYIPIPSLTAVSI